MNYVIITPAYNEAAYIGKTISTVLDQTVKPLLWVIVDDGSADQTADIVKQYASQYQWIHYVYRQKVAGQSYYGSNVYAIYEGITHLQNVGYDFLAILDADISLPQDYYEQLLKRMEVDDRLGITSGVYVDNVNGNLRKVLNDRRSTPKALMVFRRSCFEQIGSFLPMKYGGEDTVACFKARMKGWKTWSYPDIVAIHNKPIGTGHAKNYLKIRFRNGIGEYYLASHPLFFLLKSLRRCCKERPFIFGGLARIAGFAYAHFLKEPRQISNDLIRYIRKEQFHRIVKCNKIPTEAVVQK